MKNLHSLMSRIPPRSKQSWVALEFFDTAGAEIRPETFVFLLNETTARLGARALVRH